MEGRLSRTGQMVINASLIMLSTIPGCSNRESATTNEPNEETSVINLKTDPYDIYIGQCRENLIISYCFLRGMN